MITLEEILKAWDEMEIIKKLTLIIVGIVILISIIGIVFLPDASIGYVIGYTFAIIFLIGFLFLVIYAIIKIANEIRIRSELKKVTKEVEDEWNSQDKGRVEVESKKEKETSRSIINNDAKIGVALIVFVLFVVITVLAFMGDSDEGAPLLVSPTPSKRPIYSTPTPTPPLECISDKVRDISIRIAVINLNIIFKDAQGRYLSTLNDGTTRIKIESYYAYIGSDDKILLDTKNYNIKAGEEFIKLDLPNCKKKNVLLEITIILPNGQTRYAYTNFEQERMNNELLYDNGYNEGEDDAYMGYSAKIPWDRAEYYRDGYTDGYIGATPRYRFSPITIEGKKTQEKWLIER